MRLLAPAYPSSDGILKNIVAAQTVYAHRGNLSLAQVTSPSRPPSMIDEDPTHYYPMIALLPYLPQMLLIALKRERLLLVHE